MKNSTSSPPAAQRLFTGEGADTSLFPPLCVYFHRTLYSPSPSFLSLRSLFLLLPSLLRRCFSCSCLSCNGESSTGKQETRKSDLKEVYLDASYILLRVYCALTNLQLQFIPLRYPSAHAAATLPAAWWDDRLLQLRQILVLLQQTRDLDALAVASSSHSVSTGAAGGLQEERLAPAATAWKAGSASAAIALGVAAAAGERNAHNEFLEKDLAVATDDSDAEVLRRRLKQQSAAIAAFIEQRLGSALQYILWVYEPCRKYFTFPVFTQNLPFIYVTPLLLWTRRKSLQQEQARPLKEALLDIIAVLELLDLQQLQQQVKRQRQQVEKKRQQQQLHGNENQQHSSFFEGASSPAGGVSAETAQQPKSQQQQQHFVEEEAATTVETAPGTEAAAPEEDEEEDEEEEEEEEKKNKERKQCLTGLFSASEDNEDEGLQPEFLLVPEAPTLADVYLYAYLFVLLQLPPHLLPWHEEEIAASSAAPSLVALAASSSPAAATSACVAAARAAANEEGNAWLSSDASLLNFCDDAYGNSSAAAYQLLQQDKQEEHLHKKKIVRLLPLARQYLQRFEKYLFQLRGVCMCSGEATAAGAAPAAAKSLHGTGVSSAATSYFPPATPPTADALSVKPTPQRGETAAGGAEWNACLACLPPLPVHACSAARAASYDRTLLQQQRRGSDSHNRRNKGKDDVGSTKTSSNSTKSSTDAAPVSKDSRVAVSDEEAEQHSNSRDRKPKQAVVFGKSPADAVHARISCRKKRSSEDSTTRGFLAIAAAAAMGALVIYIGSTTRTGYRRLILN